MRLVFAMAMFAWAAAAVADLYRWVDPESGSVKYSSYPPPWYGDEARQRRAPKVEHIPSRRDALARPDPVPGSPQDGARSFVALEAQRKAMLQQILAGAARGGPERSPQALQKQLEEYGKLSQQLDKLNPEGAVARRGEAEAALQRLIRGELR